MEIFDEMAVAGSCPGGDSNSPDCEPTIVADTPESLKTQLTAKIRQILAERLSFTAPSITATVQEGGSLYQAQFDYAQNSEWTGTIKRTAIDKKIKSIVQMFRGNAITIKGTTEERIAQVLYSVGLKSYMG